MMAARSPADIMSEHQSYASTKYSPYQRLSSPGELTPNENPLMKSMASWQKAIPACLVLSVASLVI